MYNKLSVPTYVRRPTYASNDLLTDYMYMAISEPCLRKHSIPSINGELP